MAIPEMSVDEGASSTRARILTAAERLFAAHGFDRVSMPAIAKASGITAGAIYRHFDSKDDLFFEVIRRTVQSIPQPPNQNLSEAMTLPRIVAMFASDRLKVLRQLAVEMHYASTKNAKVRRLLRGSIEHDIERIRSGIAQAQAAGKIDRSIDPQMLGSTVMVFIMGMMHMETLLPQKIGDAAWQDFVEARVAALIGLR
jgi:AcrR family transcriptional regulator